MIVTPELRPFITLSVFACTLLLVLLKPRGINEAWFTAIGGASMLALRLEDIPQACRTVGDSAPVLIFLFALCLLSALLDKAGFFEWAALWSAQIAKGSGVALYRNVFLVGAVVTAFLSLDTTAIILTPIVISLVGHLKIKAHPFLVACVFVANTGSLILPVSNLTNLLFQSAFHFQFADFTLHMVVPQIMALLVNYWLFKFIFKKDLPLHFDSAILPKPASAINDRPYFYVALLVLLFVLICYFLGAIYNVQPFVVALAGCFLLICTASIRRQLDYRRLFSEIPWSLFPFIIGLLVLIRGIENLGLAGFAAHECAATGDNLFGQIFASSLGTAIGSNIINNIPMAMLSISVLQNCHASTALQLGALIGCNLGPNLTIAGSLATILVISSARKKNENLSAWEFFKIGLLTTPLLLIASSLALWVVLSFFP